MLPVGLCFGVAVGHSDCLKVAMGLEPQHLHVALCRGV